MPNPNRIKPGTSKKGVTNITLNTRSHPEVIERLQKVKELMEKDLSIPLNWTQCISLLAQRYIMLKTNSMEGT